MTEKLKNLMDEVTGMVDQDFATPDLDAIVRSGDRAVRRRRVLAGAAGVAALAVIATGTLLAGGVGDDKADVADDVFPTDVPLWAVGSTLHTPDHTYDLGVGVTTLVRTSEGIAFVGKDDAVYTFDGSRVDRIGSAVDTESSPLVGDPEGDWVGWISNDGDQRDFVARDVVSGTEVRDAVELDPEAEKPLDAGLFLAIDGTTAYHLDARGTTRTDLSTGESAVVGEADHPTLIISAADGLVVTWIETRTGGDIGTDVVDADGRVVLGHEGGRTVGALSPDGTWAADIEAASVWEVGTGREVGLDAGNQGDAIGYEWLDDDSLMVLAEGSGDAIRLLQCEVPAGTCADVTELDVSGEPLALPSYGLFAAMLVGGAATSTSASEEASAVIPAPSSSTGAP
ncbi:hypothetical protein [Nocardioides sp. MH1]|uniref:hypothetical protein n=1 Tax=Nocardioides sp. MH1 TaxID=3242490 RepID=UPI00352203CB